MEIFFNDDKTKETKVLQCILIFSWYHTHVFEGDDDMPAHIKTTLVGSSIQIPISEGKLNLGIWQGIYLCEFRNHGGSRSVVCTIYS